MVDPIDPALLTVSNSYRTNIRWQPGCIKPVLPGWLGRLVELCGTLGASRGKTSAFRESRDRDELSVPKVRVIFIVMDVWFNDVTNFVARLWYPDDLM